jgi:hypothetical protein
MRIEAKSTQKGYKYSLIDSSYKRQEIPDICFESIDETDDGVTIEGKELLIVGITNE